MCVWARKRMREIVRVCEPSVRESMCAWGVRERESVCVFEECVCVWLETDFINNRKFCLFL